MAEYWDGTGVTAGTLEGEVRRLAAEQPDHVYDATNFPDLKIGAKCKYTHTLEDKSQVPGCIVGQAIFNLTGKLVNQEIHGGGVLDFRFMRDEYNLGWSDRARFLANVQYHQDMQKPWGLAVTLADDKSHPENWWQSSDS